MAVQNSIAQRQQKGSFSTFMALPAVKQKVYDIIAGDRGDRFITSIITAVGTNPTLAECDYSSILSAALLGESLRLSPSPQLGQFYLVPYNNRKRGIKEAQFQLGYKGYVQLAMRSGQYKDLDVVSVKEGELVSYDPFTNAAVFNPILNPEERSKAKTIGYFAYFKLLNGFEKQLYWSSEQMKIHAKTYSPGYASDLSKGTSYTFWSKNFDGMAHKTMLRQILSKGAPLSIDMQEAFISDMASIKDDGQLEYIDSNENIEIFKEVKEVEQVQEAPSQNIPESASNETDVIPEDIVAQFFSN